MGEVWMGIWMFLLLSIGIGLLVIFVAIYDYRDRIKRNQEIKRWKYVLAILVGLILASPALICAVLWLLRLLFF